MSAFDRYIGIDYSGAQTPSASLKGLRVYLADGNAPPARCVEVSSEWSKQPIICAIWELVAARSEPE